MKYDLPDKFEITSDSTNDSIREIDFFYPSDNLHVRGHLFLPDNSEPPFKLIVFNHGGINGIYEGIIIISRELARDSNYAVFAPSYRGEDDSEGEIEIAAGEVDDVLNGLNLLLESSIVDRENIYMVGSSHGALITLIAMAKDKSGLIKKGVFGYGVADIFKWWYFLDENAMHKGTGVSASAYPGSPDEYPEYFKKRNGVEYISQINAPLLIIHGEEDRLVPLEQACILKKAADGAGIENVNLVVIPDAGHGLLTKRETFEDGSYEKSAECISAWELILQFINL
ncbi:prolyl oligopeptidase family serine peptidase [bacterium]|nr:prolyl oligopeptidase family serine peptidase [bacterium]